MTIPCPECGHNVCFQAHNDAKAWCYGCSQQFEVVEDGEEFQLRIEGQQYADKVEKWMKAVGR